MPSKAAGKISRVLNIMVAILYGRINHENPWENVAAGGDDALFKRPKIPRFSGIFGEDSEAFTPTFSALFPIYPRPRMQNLKFGGMAVVIWIARFGFRPRMPGFGLLLLRDSQEKLNPCGPLDAPLIIMLTKIY
jgi:hypothetical protein